jgi:flagellar biosynthesis protein FliR
MNGVFDLLAYILKTFEVGNSPQTFLVLFGLCFARIVSYVAFVPFLGGKAVPSKVKIAVALSLTVIAYPQLAAEVAQSGGELQFGPVGFFFLMLKECFIGFTLSYISSAVFEGIQMAGRFIDVQRGASMAEILAPQLNERVTELGEFKFQLSLVLFIMAGLHREFIKVLIDSFAAIPATRLPEVHGNLTPSLILLINVSAETLLIGVQLALPIVLALLLTDVFFGIINKVAPQINVFFLSMPVKMMLGLFVFSLSILLLKDQYGIYFLKSLNSLKFMVEYFGQNKAF